MGHEYGWPVDAKPADSSPSEACVSPAISHKQMQAQAPHIRNQIKQILFK